MEVLLFLLNLGDWLLMKFIFNFSTLSYLYLDSQCMQLNANNEHANEKSINIFKTIFKFQNCINFKNYNPLSLKHFSLPVFK